MVNMVMLGFVCLFVCLSVYIFVVIVCLFV